MTHAPQGDDLNFDAAIPATAQHAGTGVRCANCGRQLTEQYHTANGKPVCATCRATLQELTSTVSEPAVLVKSLLFGLGAAIAGGFVYWAVLYFLELEIGFVAILSGWMIGKAMHAGAGNRGGRLLQVFALLLVYLSVSGAYLPFAISGAEGGIGLIGAIIALATLPLIIIVGGMPGTILSMIIIGVGMRQAWQMTAAPTVLFEGPFRVSGAPPPAAALPSSVPTPSWDPPAGST